MSLDHEGRDVGQLNAHILRRTLGAQLVLLAGSFPLTGWVIGREQDAEFTMLAAQGSWSSSFDLSTVGKFMNGSWKSAPDATSFEYRMLSADEQLALNTLVPDSAAPDCVIRHALRNADGHVLGWLIGVAAYDAVSIITQADFQVDYVEQVVLAMGLCLALYVNFEKMHHQLVELQQNAFIEPLTGVLNRAGWMNRVQHLEAIVARTDEDVAIIMLDLDLLKLVNDQEGHSAGDELLQLTARTIQSVVRASDVAGRLGGDEFGIAVRGMGTDLADGLVSRLRAALNHVGVNVSMGLALKSEAGSLDDTLVLADQRMYQEKRAKPMPADAMSWQRRTSEASLYLQDGD